MIDSIYPVRTNFAAPLVAAAALALAGCASMGAGDPAVAASRGVEVTRSHLGGPANAVARGTVAVTAATTAPTDVQSTDFRAYAAAVTRQLQRAGYTPVAAGASSAFVARVTYRRGALSTPAAVPAQVAADAGIATELFVTIERAIDATVIWEGRATTAARGTGPGGFDPQADKLAAALFKGFPGESGRTITLP